ncbi:DUF7146 domain-containing protein [Sphingomonas bacterium]|uniref:DUF7146 domain-containing protein n=1 Tax=Sphingomonas bacterium TaxID=1895847 RepID=UPI001575ED71|nr:toprim domain-containing protein [Sphingomonas bacterium]
MALIANRPSQQLVDLVGALGGAWHGNAAMCRCPAHSDRTASLSLRQGDRGILVTCFAGCDPEDVLRELGRIPLSHRHAPPPVEPATRTANIDRLWAEARPVPGTLGERYLATRHLLPMPTDVRFHPRCPLGPKPTTRFLPALLVGAREGRHLMAFQRIFLDPKTAGYREKATLGTLGHAAWQGGGCASTIGLAEGFETARAWSRIRGHPCWATFGSRRLDLVDVPASVTRLVLAGDNDLAGRRAVARALEAHAAPGRMIEVDVPEDHKDWARVLEVQERGGGAGG